jgi:hypothetical protein
VPDAENPWGDDKRRHPRVELYATLTLKGLEEVYVLKVRNLSMGGAFVLADGLDLSAVKVGAEHEVVLTDGENPVAAVVLKALVVRNVEEGLGIKWLGEEDMFKVAGILDAVALSDD